jgi:hypothetical protein
MARMTVGTQRRLGRLVVLTAALALSSFGSGSPPAAQGRWPYSIEWEVEGAGAPFYQLCVNDECSPLYAQPMAGGTWRAALPMLPVGEHRLVVRACGFDACVPGTPDLIVRVVPPSSRRPMPVDVIQGPPIQR